MQVRTHFSRQREVSISTEPTLGLSCACAHQSFMVDPLYRRPNDKQMSLGAAQLLPVCGRKVGLWEECWAMHLSGIFRSAKVTLSRLVCRIVGAE